MAKYGSNSVVVNFDNSGGTPVDMSQYVTTLGAITISAFMEDSEAFGDAWREVLATGVREVSPIVIGGFYDDTATTGPDVIFNAVASGPSVATRTLAVTWGSTNITSVETQITKYTRTAVVDKLTRYEVTLMASGAVTEA